MRTASGNGANWSAATKVTMSENDGTFYMLVCRDCGGGDLPMPFSTPAERGKWAAAHTRTTGHDNWFVTDQRLEQPQP